MSFAKLFKVDGTPVFYKKNLVDEKDAYHADLLNEDVFGYDCFGNQMEPAKAASDLLKMADYWNPTSLEECVLRNMQIGVFLISIVRSELMTVQDGAVYLGILSDVVGQIQTGMFDTASQTLDTITQDAILTEQRIIRWQSLLTISDSIEI